MIPITKKRMPIAKKYLNAESPVERHRKKLLRVCKWALCHGVVSAEIIKNVAHQQNNSLPKQMIKKGLLIENKTVSGWPRFFYTLSQAGLDLATSYSPNFIDYNKYLSPQKISQTKFEHDFSVQKLSLLAIQKFGVKYLSQAQMATRHVKGTKIPDALWIHKNIFKIAVEIEYSQKFGRILDETLSAIIQSLVAGEFHYYYFFVRSNVIKTNYIDAMKGGRHIHSYIKNDQNRWVKDTNKLEVIPDWLLDKVFFMQEENLLGDLTSIMQACEQFAVEEVNQ
ncbi:hypothetical protein [Sapientia aquatica]|uniref:Uncharacterized protein n=1 Tax=Sapientia aquatica TaxID=1549640 RepID=A0A4R5W261_9BURK|nr:hypothetical protein [Sapientia aquatica]TDK66433.1 hypothetical protein E2I14_08135 [Sapientia aquatica]